MDIVGALILAGFFCIPIWAISAIISLVFSMIFMPEEPRTDVTGWEGYILLEIALNAVFYYYLYARFVAKYFSKLLNAIGFLVNYNLRISKICTLCGKTVNTKEYPTNIDPF